MNKTTQKLSIEQQIEILLSKLVMALEIEV
jgi:hypothetical protein